ncbi:MAG: MBL fold metallo-hydrolase [Gammaproteobacteria bacterium]|nr:MBL fold metallo-hydrolase [Gammaproteobacteria bacterium]
MHRTKPAIYLALYFMAALSFSAGAAKSGGAILPAPKQLTEHVYAWIGPLPGPSKENQGFRMNLLFVVGKDAVAVVDTGYTEAMAEEMLAHIKRITKVPVKYAINSNSQPHRFMGNPVFKRAGAVIIADEIAAERMARQAGNYAAAIESILELKPGTVKLPAPPDKIIKGDTELDLGGVNIKVWDFGPTHTPAELVVEVVQDKLVYTGDILYADRLLAVIEESNVKRWLEAYERLKQFGDAVFVPGHGQPGKLSTFDFPTRQYLALLLDHMNKMVEEGVDAQDAINRLDQSRFSKLANFEELAGRNASWTYLQREAAGFE